MSTFRRLIPSWLRFLRSDTKQQTQRRRQNKKAIFLKLERLEDRLQPASMLESIMPSFDSGSIALYSGGAVGATTTAQTSGPVEPIHQTSSGAVDPETTFA